MVSKRKSFYDYNLVAFDTETSNGRGGGSLSERDGFIALMQLKLPGQEPEIIDVLAPDFNEVQAPRIRKILSDPNNLICGHNLKFDYKWLAYNGFYIRNIFDTMIASQVYYSGIRSADEATRVATRNKKVWSGREEFEATIFSDYTDYIDLSVVSASRFSHAFDACMIRELGIEISKAEQTSDWAARPLSEEQIEYALWDVRKTTDLAEVLYNKLRGHGMEDVFWLEMDVEHAIAFKEVTGVLVDKPAWEQMSRDLSAEVKAEKKQLESELGQQLAEERGDRHGLFGIVPVLVNLNSPAMAEHLSIPNVQAGTLKEYAHTHPFIPKFIDYKIKQKLASTYGDTYLKHIGEDSRMRGEFSQAYTATGRLSSKEPNLQNAPAKHIKSMIRARPGFTNISIDFSTVELRILAYLSGDEKFIEACNSMDMHAQNARTIYGIPEEDPVPKSLRTKAKVVSFSIPYGTSAFGLYARGITETIEEAKELIDLFYNNFPKVANYLRKNAFNASVHGATRDAIGRIRRYEVPPAPANYEERKQHFDMFRKSLRGLELDFNTIMGMKYKDALIEFPELANITTKEGFVSHKEVNTYERHLASIKREGQNHPIQACVTWNTRAFTKQHGYTKLGDINVDTFYDFWDGERFVQAKVIDRGMQRMFVVLLKNGGHLTCSPRHKLLVDIDGEDTWVEAQNLTEGMKVKLTNEVSALEWDLPVELSQVDSTNSPRLQGSRLEYYLNSDHKVAVAELLGRLEGSGRISGGDLRINLRPYVTLTYLDYDSIISTSKYFETLNLFGTAWERPQYEAFNTRPQIIGVSNVELCSQIRHHTEHGIPDFVWRSASMLKGYIRGLYDAVGSKYNSDIIEGAKLYSFEMRTDDQNQSARNIQVLTDVHEGLQLLGIHSTLMTHDEGGCTLLVNEWDHYRFVKIIGFHNPLKAEVKSSEPHNDTSRRDVYSEVVLAWDSGVDVAMCDVADSTTHMFMANGVVTHNTSASITKRAMADAYDYLRDTGYGFLTLSIHDSVFYEVLTNYARYAIPDIINIMRDAGPKIVPDIITPVDLDVGHMVKVRYYDDDDNVQEEYVFNQDVDEDFNVYDRTYEQLIQAAKDS